MTPEITCQELKKKLDNRDPIVVIDVREEYERDISSIEGSIHIPLGELSKKISELNPNQSYIMQCRSGGRSAKATDILRDAGFKDVKNLVGGINRWAQEIDPNMDIY